MCNLYVSHDGVIGLVAVLSNQDRDWGGLSMRTLAARVSPDGRWLAFMSDRDLTGYDPQDVSSGQPDEEAYLYDGETGRLVCVSCDPTGARPVGERGGSELLDGDEWSGSGTWLAADLPGWTDIRGADVIRQPRYLSDSGRMFFDSYGALAPQDVNGTWDVYEYEPPGVGSCTAVSVTFSVRSGGCVGLVSSGSSGFLDASESGGDVFFLTAARLAPQDFDAALDVYDAQECTTAVPCPAVPAAAPPECVTADACRAASVPQPAVFGAPSSATFSGAGNISPAPVVAPPKKAAKKKAAKCPRGRRRSRGRCVKRLVAGKRAGKSNRKGRR
jgi:hypothetical protein